MNQNLLLKYISGKASQREKEEVAAWIDADAANLKEFMSLRKSYDALVWQDADELKTGRDKLLSLRTFTMKAMRIAVIFVLAFGLSYILIQTLQKENVEMQTVYVPAGQRTQVTLADGTMVWVNGKSTLTFLSQFASPMGDVIGDLNKRRGQVEGMESSRSGARIVKAMVPLAEMFGYVTALRTITSGRATSSMVYSHHAQVSNSIAKAVLEEVKGRADLL